MLTLTIGLAMATWYSFDQAQKEIGVEGYTILSNQTEQFLKNQVQERTRSLDLEFAQTQSVASYGAGELSFIMKGNSQDKKKVLLVLKNLYQSLGSNAKVKVFFYSSKIGFISYQPNGQSIAKNKGFKFHSSDYFPGVHNFFRHKRTTIWSIPHSSIFDNFEWVVDVIAPIDPFNPYDSFVGISISLTDLIAEFNQLHPTRGSYCFLIDEKQNLVAAPPHARIDLSPDGVVKSEEQLHLEGYQDKKLEAAMKEMALGRSALMKVSMGGNEKYLAFHPLEVMNWRVGIVVPVSFATSASIQLQTIVESEMKKSFLRIFIGAFFIFGISLLGGSLLIRHLLVPLEQVSLASKSMLDGDFKQRVVVKSSDEISSLAMVFNQMADHIQVLINHLEHRAKELEELNQSLEVKVAERTSVLEERTIQLDNANKQLKKEIKERQEAEDALTIANSTLQRLATVDSLTQIPNRRYFDERLQSEWSRLAREGLPLSLILFDVDYFKQFNDFYGHLSGDMCLVQIAKAASKSISRPADFVARYGGEEFAIVLPNTKEQGAVKIVKKLMRYIQKEAIPHEKSSVSKRVTISAGVACLVPKYDSSCEELVHLADKALYVSKENGRNMYSTN